MTESLEIQKTRKRAVLNPRPRSREDSRPAEPQQHLPAMGLPEEPFRFELHSHEAISGVRIMSKMVRGRQENQNYAYVSIAGNDRPIPVQIVYDFGVLPPEVTTLPPNIRNAAILVTLDRGHDPYGWLREDFFICRDGERESSPTILWVSLHAEQEQDGGRQSKPVCVLDAQWVNAIQAQTTCRARAFNPLKMAGLILLSAYACYAVRSWGGDLFDDTEIKGGLLSKDATARILNAARTGKPVDFSWLD